MSCLNCGHFGTAHANKHAKEAVLLGWGGTFRTYTHDDELRCCVQTCTALGCECGRFVPSSGGLSESLLKVFGEEDLAVIKG